MCIRNTNVVVLVVELYVDCNILTENCEAKISLFYDKISSILKFRAGSEKLKFLARAIEQFPGDFFVHNRGAVQKLLWSFAGDKWKPSETPLLLGFGSFPYADPERADIKSYQPWLAVWYTRQTLENYAMHFLAQYE